jgi:hypothetical protein
MSSLFEEEGGGGSHLTHLPSPTIKHDQKAIFSSKIHLFIGLCKPFLKNIFIFYDVPWS